MNIVQQDVRPILDQWRECSHEIHMRESVEAKTIELMKTKGQRVEAHIIRVPDGRLRLTEGFIEGKDSFGIPFGWSKRLIKKIVTQEGLILWSANGDLA